MTVCVIKVCRNYKGRHRTSKNVTYHRIPSDPILKSQWIDVIRRSRGEELWKPTKNSVVCSDHFHKNDKYYRNKEGRPRLKKGTVPRKALFLSSWQSDDSHEEADRCEDEINSKKVTDPTVKVEVEPSGIVSQAQVSPLGRVDTSDATMILCNCVYNTDPTVKVEARPSGPIVKHGKDLSPLGLEITLNATMTAPNCEPAVKFEAGLSGNLKHEQEPSPLGLENTSDSTMTARYITEPTVKVKTGVIGILKHEQDSNLVLGDTSNTTINKPTVKVEVESLGIVRHEQDLRHLGLMVNSEAAMSVRDCVNITEPTIKVEPSDIVRHEQGLSPLRLIDKATMTVRNSLFMTDPTINLEVEPSGIVRHAEDLSPLEPEDSTEATTERDTYMTEKDTEVDSDIDSVYDSPGKVKLKRELRRKTTLQKKHTLKIQSLRRKNIRLQNENLALKEIIRKLKNDSV